MSILTELKKLTKKTKATVISQALPDELGGGSGSGGVLIVRDISKDPGFVVPDDVAAQLNGQTKLDFYSSVSTDIIGAALKTGIVLWPFSSDAEEGYASTLLMELVEGSMPEEYVAVPIDTEAFEPISYTIDSAGYLYGLASKEK